MKNKILFLSLIWVSFVAKTYGQGTNPCNTAPYNYAAIKFTNVTQSGGSVCLIDSCRMPPSVCCYNIPLCPDSTEYVCLDGNGGGFAGACVNLTNDSFRTNGSGHPCFKVQIVTGGGIVEDYTTVYIGGTTWNTTWLDDGVSHHYTSGGIHYSDFLLEFDPTTGALFFQMPPYPPAIDDEGTGISPP